VPTRDGKDTATHNLTELGGIHKDGASCGLTDS